jgi:hypothetical protein
MDEKVVISLSRYENMKDAAVTLNKRLSSTTKVLDKESDKVRELEGFLSVLYNALDGFDAYVSAFNRTSKGYQILLDSENKRCKLEEI